MKTLVALIVALPEIIRLVERIQKEIERQQVDRKVADDIKAINDAFEAKDAQKLNEIFVDRT